MKKRLLLASIASVLCCASAQAESYQYEVSGLFGNTEVGALDADVWAFGGTYYLDLVNTSKGPLAEASFLDRASGVSLAFSGESSNATSADANGRAISGMFVSKDTGWLFGLDLSRVDIDNPDNEISSNVIHVGRYISDTTAVTFNWDHTEVGEGAAGVDADSYDFSVKHVGKHENGMSFAISASLGQLNLEDVEDNATVFGGNYTLYPNNHFGVGISYAESNADFAESTSYGVNAEWFFIDNASVGFIYNKTDPDDLALDSDTWSITGNFRF